MSLYKDASLVMIPSAYSDGRLYSIRPIPEYGSEILTQPVDISVDFTTNSGGVIVDANTFQTFGGGLDGIKRDGFVVGKQYRIEIQGTTTSSGFTYGNGSGSGNEYGSGFGVSYFTALNQRLWIRQITAGITDITTFSIKEVSNIGDFDFSRGSNLAATRVASSGYIEKGRENVLLQSNQFDTTWYNSSSTETGGQAGYDGTNDAWELSISAAAGRLTQSVGLSGVQTFSVYAKAGTYNFLDLYALGNVAHAAYFDLATGSVGSTFSLIDSSITSVGNGWYKCSITFSDTTLNVRFYPATADNDLTGTSGSIYIQDAQLESGLVATDYIETGASTAQAGILEDMPRLDYSGSCPALLLEPQRTNQLAHSEYLSGWNAYTPSSTIVNNSAISPEGVQNACEITFTGSGNDFAYDNFYYSVTAPSVFSVYLRVASGTKLVALRTAIGNEYKAVTITTEWQRFELNITQTQASERIGIDNRATYGGSGTAGTIEVYGAQLEAGSYPTSYIPTYGSSVTRSDDFMNISSLADEINGNSFTYFLEVNNEAVVRDASTGNISVGATGNRFFLYNSNAASNRLQLFIQDSGGIEQYVLSADNVKIAIRFEPNNVEVFENGVSVLSTTQNLDFSANSAYVLRGTTREMGIKQTAIFPTALTDSECIALTTL